MEVSAVAIYSSVIVNKYTGIDEDPFCHIFYRDLPLSALLLIFLNIGTYGMGDVELFPVLFHVLELCACIVLSESLKRSFGSVAYRNASISAFYIAEKVILAVLADNIRSKDMIVCPGCLAFVIAVVTCMEHITVTYPVLKIINRCRPYFHLGITEIFLMGFVM